MFLKTHFTALEQRSVASYFTLTTGYSWAVCWDSVRR